MHTIRWLYMATALLITNTAFNTQAEPYGPENLIIATDLDDVLLTWDKGSMLSRGLKHLGSLFGYYKKCRKRKHLEGSFGHKYGEPLYIEALKEGNLKVARFIRTMATQKKLLKGTLAIYQDLSHAGYTFYTATNIGSIFFEELQIRFPHVFNDGFIKHGMTVDYSLPDVAEKPDARYYHRLSEKINPDGDKHILFIDDRLENVEAARQCGLLAIQYKNSKQLIRDLHAYNICLCSGACKDTLIIL